MLFNLFNNPLSLFTFILALFTAITIHEFAHAWAADRLGDPTPRLQGRLKLNPFVHLDPMGLLFLFFFGFGWGKPVMFDPFNLKNPRKDAALISFAGPCSNFIIAIVLSLLLRLFIFFNLSMVSTIGFLLFVPMIYLNVVLGVFNLLPIHPLDGFKIVEGILPHEKALEWKALQRYGILFLLLMIFPFGGSSMLNMTMRPLVTLLIRLLIPGFNTGGVV